VKKLILFLVLIFVFVGVQAQELRVGYFNEKPYVNLANKAHPGAAIEFWNAIAHAKHWKFKLIDEGDKPKPALQNLADGKINILVGGMSVTSDRIKSVNFSRPFFIERIGLVTSEGHVSFWGIIHKVIDGIFKPKFLFVILLFIVIWGIMSWHVRSRSEGRITKKNMKNSFWITYFAFFHKYMLYEMDKSTINYVISSILMFVALIIAAVFIGAVSSAFTLSIGSSHDVTSMSQIGQHPVAVVKDSVIEDIAKGLNLRYVSVKDMAEGVKLVESDQVIGIMSAMPVAKIYLREHPLEHVHLSPIVIQYDEVAFALNKKDNTLRDQVNAELTQLQDTNKMRDVCEYYFGRKSAKLCAL
jgi:polar amino acid transport system substrate-binding protein